MWLILQHHEPYDYVLGTGETHSVREFVEEAFSYVGLDWQEFVEIDPRYLRPTEVDVLIADAAKARQKLSWEPKVTFKELVRIMVDADLEAMGLKPIGEGNKILQTKFRGWHQWEGTVTQVVEAVAGRALQ